MIEARSNKARRSKKVFISHSSQNKEFALWLAVDLANSGHKPWLDEWEIKVGESIPKKIGAGIEDCDFIAVVLSEHAVKSRWVENEWHAKYWDEVEQGKTKVIPILFQECSIPTLLKTKKYANFSEDYGKGLDEFLSAIT